MRLLLVIAAAASLVIVFCGVFSALTLSLLARPPLQLRQKTKLVSSSGGVRTKHTHSHSPLDDIAELQQPSSWWLSQTWAHEDVDSMVGGPAVCDWWYRPSSVVGTGPLLGSSAVAAGSISSHDRPGSSTGNQEPPLWVLITEVYGLDMNYTLLLRQNRLAFMRALSIALGVRHVRRGSFDGVPVQLAYCEVNKKLDRARDIAWSKVLAIGAVLGMDTDDIKSHAAPVAVGVDDAAQRRQPPVHSDAGPVGTPSTLGVSGALWMDADAVVLNFSQTLVGHFIDGLLSATVEADVDRRANATAKDIAWTLDPYPSCKRPRVCLNTGIFAARNTRFVRSLLASVYQDYPWALRSRYWEQAAIVEHAWLHKAQWDEKCVVVSMQCCAQFKIYYRVGDTARFSVLHWGGGHKGDKYTRLQRVIHQVAQGQAPFPA